MLYRNKFRKTILMLSANHDILCHKYRPATHPIHFAAYFTRQNPSLRCVGGFLFLWETHLENFMSRPNVIPTFRQRRCTNRGRNFVRSKRRLTYMSRNPLLIFCVLTIRKHLLKMRFERSGGGQEPSRGHKFSILENVVRHRDFTSAMRLHFRSDLVGVALVGAKPLHLLSQTALPLKSPTGAFIAPLRFANAVPPQTLLIVRT